MRSLAQWCIYNFASGMDISLHFALHIIQDSIFFTISHTLHLISTISIMTDNNQTKTYKQQATEYYNQKYEIWIPWIEDQYLKWFTKDNKASYATKRMRCFPSTQDYDQLTAL